MMRKFFFPFVSLWLITTCVLSAQVNTNIVGIVVDSDGHPLEGVTVYSQVPIINIRTGKDGVFTIPRTKGMVSFFLQGYNSETRNIPLSMQKQWIVRLTKISYKLNDIVIQQKRKKRDYRTLRDVEGMTINAGRKTEVVVLSDMTVNKTTNNARQVFAKVAGLTIDEGSDGGIQLNIGARGLNPNRSANFNTRQDGYDISADVLGYPESYYTPADNGVKEIQVIRGAASLQYGTQFGGMINFKMRQPSLREFAGRALLSYGSYNLLSSFIDAGGTINQFSYYGYYDYKQGNGYRPNSVFSAHNAFLNLNYIFDDDNTLHIDLVKFHYLAKQPGGLTDYMFYTNPKQSNRTRNWFDVDWNIADLRYEHIFTPQQRFMIHIFGLMAERKALGFRSYRVSDPDPVNSPRDLLVGQFNNWGAELRFIDNYTLFNHSNVLLVGAKYYQSHNLSDQGPGDNSDKPHFKFVYNQYPNYTKVSHFVYPNLNLALFAENIIHLSDKTTITPGFRLEKIITKIDGDYNRVVIGPNGLLLSKSTIHDYNKKDRFVPLLGIGFSHKEKDWELYANLSQNYRSVTFSDIHSITPGFSISPTITDEKGFSSDIGLRGHLFGCLYYDSSIYGLYYGDKIGEYYRINKQYNTVERYRDNVGTAFTYGFETLLNWDINQAFIHNPNLGLSTYINTSLTKGEYLKSDIPNIKGNAVEFVPFVNLRYGIETRYKRLKSSIQLTYVGEQFTDASNQPTDKMERTSGIFGSIPAYYVVDFSSSFQVNKYMDILLSIQNLTNNYYFTRRATGYPGPGIIPSDPFNFVMTLSLHL